MTHSLGTVPLRLTSQSQADIVFWMGDLNYRIVEEVPDAEVFDMIEADELEKLRQVSHAAGSRVSLAG